MGYWKSLSLPTTAGCTSGALEPKRAATFLGRLHSTIRTTVVPMNPHLPSIRCPLGLPVRPWTRQVDASFPNHQLVVPRMQSRSRPAVDAPAHWQLDAEM